MSKSFFFSTLGSVAMHGAVLFGAAGLYSAAQFALPVAPTAMEVSLTASPSSSGESGRASSEYGRRTLSRSRPVVSEPPTDAVSQAKACPTASVGTRFLRHASSEANPDSPEKKGHVSKPIPGADVTSIHVGTLSNTHGACPAVNPPPLYPRAARRQGIEGKVLLSVVISSDGKAENVSVASSSGSSLLDEAAQNGIRRWIFIPALRLGTPVASEMAIPVVFKLKD